MARLRDYHYYVANCHSYVLPFENRTLKSPVFRCSAFRWLLYATGAVCVDESDNKYILTKNLKTSLNQSCLTHDDIDWCEGKMKAALYFLLSHVVVR